LHKDKIVNVHQLLASLPDFSRLRLVGVADLQGKQPISPLGLTAK
jgi:hypothetical protein